MKTSYKNFAIKLAKRAGRTIKKNFVSVGAKKQWKEDQTPVTETDLAINRMVIEEVKKHFPDHGVLGEEESHNTAGKKYVWVCDPIDGTIPFSHGWQCSVFSLALVEDGVPIVGVLYDPYLDRMVAAEKGKGATLNGKPIFVNKQKDFPNSVMGLIYFNEDYNTLPIIKKFGEERVMVVNLGSICYMGMLLAMGEFIAAVFPGTTAHDCAAIKIIVEEAGGKVTDFYGQEQRYDQKVRGFVASNGLVHDRLVKLLNP